MPAVIDPGRCNQNFELCFSARVCPESAFSQIANGSVVIDSTLCGDCAGPCLNFCDGYAIRYEADPDAFEILSRQVTGAITMDQAVDEMQQLAKQREAERAAASPVIEVTIDNFVEEILEGDLPVLVDFWAPWCGPCRKFAPVYEAAAVQYSDSLKFTKVNTEQEIQLASQFQISSIPTLMVFHQGRLADRKMGALSDQQLSAYCQQLVSALVATEPLEPSDQSAST